MFNSTYRIRGKHAEYMRSLINTSDSDFRGKRSNIFNYGYDVLLLAPILGAVMDREGIEESVNEYKDFEIASSQVIKKKKELEETLILVGMYKNRSVLSTKEDLRRFFNSIEDRKDMFHSYLLGGIEFLYEKLVYRGSNQRDYLENTIDFLVDYRNQFILFDSAVKEELINEYESKVRWNQ